MKKTAFSLFLGVAVFFVPAVSSAAIVNQTEAGSQITVSSTSVNPSWWVGSTTSAFHLDGVSLILGTPNGTESTVYLEWICFNSFSTTTIPSICSGTTGYQQSGVVLFGSGSGGVAVVQFSFASTTPNIPSGKWLMFRLTYSHAPSDGGIAIMGAPYTQFDGQDYLGGNSQFQLSPAVPYFALNTVWSALGITQATASSSSLFSNQTATSTLAALAGQCSQTGNVFAEAICIAGAFLIVPSPSALAQFSGLPALLGTKFPFSYVASVATTWNSLVASSTANAPTYQFQLHDLGIGSTTPLGNILPNFVGFSSSTVQQYMPAGFLDTFKTFAGFAILLTLIADIFFTARNLMH